MSFSQKLTPPFLRRILLAGTFSLAPLLAYASDPVGKGEDADDTDEIIANPTASKSNPLTEKFWAAVKLLQSRQPADVASGRAALDALAAQEYPHAQYLLGTCLLSGSYGYKKDSGKAANYIRLAAERGNAFAIVSLGGCYASGTGVRKDEAKAATWLAAALAPSADYSQPAPPASPDPGVASSGSNVAGALGSDPVNEAKASAHFLLGQILGRKKSFAEAHEHMVAAATAGVASRSGIYPAAVQAALNFAFGQGTARDLAKANAMLDLSRKLTARLGVKLVHNYANLKIIDEFAVADLEESVDEAGNAVQRALQMHIANVLANKKSKDYNPAEAVKWYDLAATNNQAWAMVELAFIHVRGDLGKPDPAQAFAWFEKAGSGETPKHYLAAANLAICYANGYGTPRDTAKAEALFKQHRDVEFVCYLGSIGECPRAPVNYDQMFKLLEQRAKKKDPQAQYFLGMSYARGDNGTVDYDKAVSYFKKAAASNHGGALCELGVIAEYAPILIGRPAGPEPLEQAYDYYRRGSLAGNVQAMANCANMLATGTGVRADPEQAERLYLKCLELNPRHAQAHNNLAGLYATKLANAVEDKDVEAAERFKTLAFEHLEAALAGKYAYAARTLGRIYFDGTLAPRDYAKAYGYFEQAVEFGQPEAHFDLGVIHHHGLGVPVTYTEAAYHYRLAALEGNDEALRRLINFYLTGRGVSLDLDRAIFWLNLKLDRGDLEVLPAIGDILYKKGDYATLIPILRRMIKLDAKPKLAGYAYYRLGLCYTHGLGVKANLKRAATYASEAVKRGNGEALFETAEKQFAAGNTAAGLESLKFAATSSKRAMFKLGQWYFRGENLPQDKDQGLDLIKNAALNNDTNALYFLAELTLQQEPGAPTLDQAIELAEQAEKIGHSKAAALLEKLEQRRKELDSSPEESSRARSS